MKKVIADSGKPVYITDLYKVFSLFRIQINVVIKIMSGFKMLITGFEKNVIHFRFKASCIPDDVEDMYDFFGIHAIDFDESTVIIYDFSSSYLKKNDFIKKFIELIQVYPFKAEYFSGLKALSEVIFEKLSKDITDINRQPILKEKYETLCKELTISPISID